VKREERPGFSIAKAFATYSRRRNFPASVAAVRGRVLGARRQKLNSMVTRNLVRVAACALYSSRPGLKAKQIPALICAGMRDNASWGALLGMPDVRIGKLTRHVPSESVVAKWIKGVKRSAG